MANRTYQNPAELLERVAELDAQSAELSEQSILLTEQISGLCQLYVAAHRLHESVRLDAVLAGIYEVIANLVGSEQIAVFSVDHTRSPASLRVLASHNVEHRVGTSVALDVGIFADVVASRQPFFSDQPAIVDVSERAPVSVCIPLVIEDCTFALVAVYGLLPQKIAGIEDHDREVLDALALHAATALYCATLHEAAKGRPC